MRDKFEKRMNVLEELNRKILNMKRKFVKSGFIDDNYTTKIQGLDIGNRPGLIKIDKVYSDNFPCFKLKNFLVEGFSSGEDSEPEEILREASMHDVVSTIIDFDTIRLVNNINDFPKEAKPGVIFTNVDDWMTTEYFRRFIEETPCFM